MDEKTFEYILKIQLQNFLADKGRGGKKTWSFKTALEIKAERQK